MKKAYVLLILTVLLAQSVRAAVLTVTGAEQKVETKHYVAIPYIPDGATKSISITASGEGDVETPDDKCEKCVNGQTKTGSWSKVDKKKFVFSSLPSGAKQPHDGPTINWTIDSSSTPGEYEITLDEITQKFKCSVTDETKEKSKQIGVSVTVVLIKLTIEAQDDTQDVGVRKSFKVLKVVYKDKPQSATLTASIDGAAWFSGYPTWSGTDVKGKAGATVASWKGKSSSKPQIMDGLMKQFMQISVSGPNTKKITLSKEHSPAKEIVEAINSFITRYATAKPVTLAGSISGELENVGFYNDGERLGKRATFKGKLSGTINGFKAPFVPVPIPAFPAVKLEPIFEVSKWTNELSADIKYDQSRETPWQNLEGGYSGSTDAKMGVKVFVGDDNLVAFGAQATGSTAITGEGIYSREDLSIFIEPKINAGNITAEFTVFIKVKKTLDITLYKAEKTFVTFFKWEPGKVLVYKISS
jgi:hypothetical protein